MSVWPSAKPRRVLAALANIGWTVKRQSGSHKTLQRPGYNDYTFAFHDSEEIGPKALARIAKRTGLKPEDLENGCTANLTAEPLDAGESERTRADETLRNIV